MIIPKEKGTGDRSRPKAIREAEKQYRKGVITDAEALQQESSISGRTGTDKISNVMLDTLKHNQGKKEYNPVSLMVDSALVATNSRCASSPVSAASWPSRSGDIIEKPILANFREGLTVLEYFISDSRRSQRPG